MKLTLNEKTLNAYINRAILEELSETGNASDHGVPNFYKQYMSKNTEQPQPRVPLMPQKEEPQTASTETPQTETAPEKEGDEAPFLHDSFKVSQFQVWYNRNMKGRLVIDGKWGPNTKKAWCNWVAQSEA